MSTDGYIKCGMYTMEYYSTIKKEILFIIVTTWIDLEGIMLSEISRRKQIPHDVTYIWNLNNNKKTKPIDTENRLVVAGGKVGGWG